MKATTTTAMALTGLVLLVAGCGEGGTAGGEDKETTTAASTSAEAAAEPEGCEEVTKDFGEAILDGTPEGATPLKYVDGAAFAAPSGSGVYYVAIRFDDGQGEETGVWAATNLKSGPFRSVDGLAKEFTQWPAEEGIDVTAPGVSEAKDCLPGD